ncbi:MAG: putative cardiolipin synthase [Enterobacterales bacterium]|jgi:putative cardiolipin synthase
MHNHTAFLAVCFLLISGCASIGPQPRCGIGYQNIENCPPNNAINDDNVNQHYDIRTWRSYSTLKRDPLEIGMSADIPTQSAAVKIIGPTQQKGVQSIASKIWLIDHAEHTVDAAYYIFSRDLIGRAVLGAMCNAVKRGVDVRLMVDSIGSLNTLHSELKALINCSAEGGFIRNKEGQITTKKARAQVVIFNALSKVFVRINRRSHDKLLVIDGSFADKAFVMTGGRNISLDYYGITADGQPDHSAFKDMEIILKAGSESMLEELKVGRISEIYHSLLFLHKGNKKLTTWLSYEFEAERAQEALTTLKRFPEFAQYYSKMPEFFNVGFKEAKVRLAHELDNLENEDVVEKFQENRNKNPNSIVTLLNKIGTMSKDLKTIRIVSPYLFLPEYTGPTGKVIYDAKDELDTWLAADPERSIEIITNSMLTSDNFMAQSIIDMDMAPRMLLSEEVKERWKGDEDKGELNPDFMKSKQWRSLINNSRIKIYQLGRLDSQLIGGDKFYGKLHAKFIVADHLGFVGTTNLDYRSRLYNNEMGFFFQSDELQSELDDVFEFLKSQSYLWGSEDWLKMRQKVRDIEGFKGRWAKKQRTTFTRLRITGLKWQI